MGRIGSKEMNLIWENFGITEMCSGLNDITGSSLENTSKILSGIGSACCNPSDWGDGIRGWHEAGRPPK